jgi:hypothetical protein
MKQTETDWKKSGLNTETKFSNTKRLKKRNKKKEHSASIFNFILLKKYNSVSLKVRILRLIDENGTFSLSKRRYKLNDLI